MYARGVSSTAGNVSEYAREREFLLNLVLTKHRLWNTLHASWIFLRKVTSLNELNGVAYERFCKRVYIFVMRYGVENVNNKIWIKSHLFY